MKQVQEDVFYYIENNLIIQDFFQEQELTNQALPGRFGEIPVRSHFSRQPGDKVRHSTSEHL